MCTGGKSETQVNQEFSNVYKLLLQYKDPDPNASKDSSKYREKVHQETETEQNLLLNLF